MKKWAVSILVAAVSVTGAWWYFSPYLVMLSMRSAIEARNAEAFNSHVDYPSVRESLKAQLAARVPGQASDPDKRVSDAESLGKALGRALIAPMVDALVRPEVVMRAMDQGVLEPRGNPGPEGRGEKSDAGSKAWKVEREGADRVVVVRKDPDQNGKRMVAVVFDRRGFADWRLTALRLPSK